MTDNQIDALEVGNKLFERFRDVLLDAAAASVFYQNYPTQLRRLKAGLGRNPKHFIIAIRRFPEMFDPELPTADVFEILGALKLHKIKDDSLALRIFTDWCSDQSLSLTDLDEMIAVAKPKRERKASLAERVAEELANLDCLDVVEVANCARNIACIPEVKRVLERKP